MLEVYKQTKLPAWAQPPAEFCQNNPTNPFDTDVEDQRLMAAAVEAARQSSWATRPNPKVGAAVRLASGEIVSAAHERSGGPHAEMALLHKLKLLGFSARGLTLAVTLEPCSHFGKTPPCAPAIVEAGIVRVLVGVADPSPKVAGRGLKILRDAGLEVKVGVLAERCFDVAESWLCSEHMRRPFVRLKMATSLDGAWASEHGDSRWITSVACRLRGHDFRESADVIVTSGETLRRDDPALTARDARGALRPFQPRPVVVSRQISIQNMARFKLGSCSPSVMAFDDFQQMESWLKNLFVDHQVHEVLIEAGPTLATTFLQAGLVDQILHFSGARYLGGAGARRLGVLGGGTLPGLAVELIRIEKDPDSSDLLQIFQVIRS